MYGNIRFSGSGAAQRFPHLSSTGCTRSYRSEYFGQSFCIRAGGVGIGGPEGLGIDALAQGFDPFCVSQIVAHALRYKSPDVVLLACIRGDLSIVRFCRSGLNRGGGFGLVYGRAEPSQCARVHPPTAAGAP